MSKSPRNWGFATRALHAGYHPEEHNNSRVVPLYQTTAYVFNDSEHAANLFRLEEPGFIYTRINNPTIDVFEKRMADLEGASLAVAFASGMAAISAAVLNICKTGDAIISSASLYGGTFHLFKDTLPRMGITTHFVDSSDPDTFAAAITPQTRLLYCETVGNPRIDIPDFKRISEIARANNLPLFVDNTVASPYLCRPLEHGADVVIHSASKYIGGHGGSLGGIVLAGGNFDWVSHTPHLKAYAGFPSPYILGIRDEMLRDYGAAMAPMNAYLFVQGLETLALRMKRHGENTVKVATWLRNHPDVAWINSPIFEDHPSYETAKRYVSGGTPALLSFGLRGGYEAAKQLVDRVCMIHHLANLGDTKTLILHPASTSHEPLSPEDRLLAGAPDDLIRMSVGLEDPEDIIADLEGGLKRD